MAAFPVKNKKTTKRSPGGKPSVKHKPKKPSAATCGVCGSQLHGVPRRSTVGMAKLAKTEKRPERPFGGVLCHACVMAIVKEKARLKAGTITPRETDFRHLKYLKA